MACIFGNIEPHTAHGLMSVFCFNAFAIKVSVAYNFIGCLLYNVIDLPCILKHEPDLFGLHSISEKSRLTSVLTYHGSTKGEILE